MSVDFRSSPLYPVEDEKGDILDQPAESGKVASVVSQALMDAEIARLDAAKGRWRGGFEGIIQELRRLIAEGRGNPEMQKSLGPALRAFHEMAETPPSEYKHAEAAAVIRFLMALEPLKTRFSALYDRAEDLLDYIKDKHFRGYPGCFIALNELVSLRLPLHYLLDARTFGSAIDSIWNCNNRSLICELFRNRPASIPAKKMWIKELEDIQLQKLIFTPEEYQRLRGEYLDSIFSLSDEENLKLGFSDGPKYFIEWCNRHERWDLIQRYAEQVDRKDLVNSIEFLKSLGSEPRTQKIAEGFVESYRAVHFDAEESKPIIALFQFLFKNPDCSARGKIEHVFDAFLARIVNEGDIQRLTDLIERLERITLPSGAKIQLEKAFEAIEEKILREGHEIFKLIQELSVDEGRVRETLRQMPIFASLNKGLLDLPLSKEVLQDALNRFLFQMIEQLTPYGDADETIEHLFRILAKMPFSFSLIEGLIRRGEAPVRNAERELIAKLRRSLPDQNRALVGYELMRKETDKMDLGRFKKETLKIGDESFEVYDTKGAEFQFFVHAAGLAEGIPEKVVQEKLKKGFLCTSVISGEVNSFYGMNSKYGLILSVNPKNIVAIARQDSFTPSYATDRWINGRLRLQLLTGYIEKLYRESGIQGSRPTDSFSSINRALSLQRDRMDLALHPLIEELSKSVLANKDVDEHRLQVLYVANGIAQKMIEEVLHPENRAKASPEVVRELERCRDLMPNHQQHVHPLQSPGELVRQTPAQSPNSYNESGDSPYNEVNLDLLTRHEVGRDPIAVRAILIDRSSFLEKPNYFRVQFEDARRKGIPILVREDAPISAARFLRAAKEGELGPIHRALQKRLVDETTLGAGLHIAAEEGKFVLVATILERSNPKDEVLMQAFQAALARGHLMVLQSFLKNRPALFKEAAIQAMLTGSKKIAVSMADYLTEAGLLPAEMAEKAFFLLLEGGNSRSKSIYEKFKDRFSEEAAERAVRYLVEKQYYSLNSLLPLDLVEKAFRFALENDDEVPLSSIASIKGAPDRLDASLVREAIKRGFDNRYDRSSLIDLVKIDPTKFGSFALQLAASRGDIRLVEGFLKVSDHLNTLREVFISARKAGHQERVNRILDALRLQLPAELKEIEREFLLERASEFNYPSDSILLAERELTKIAPFLGAKKARELALLASASMRSDEFRWLFEERLLEIPEPEFWSVRAYLSHWIQSLGEQPQFMTKGQMKMLLNRLEALKPIILERKEPAPVPRSYSWRAAPFDFAQRVLRTVGVRA